MALSMAASRGSDDISGPGPLKLLSFVLVVGFIPKLHIVIQRLPGE